MSRWMVLASVVFTVACFWFFCFQYQYHLFFIEQMQLFMLSSSHFLTYFEKPAALASYSGDFLVQFYYLRGGGALVITLLLASIGVLTLAIIRRFRNFKNWFILSFLPVVGICILHLDINYPLSATMAFLYVLIMIFLYTVIVKKSLRMLLLAFMALFGYWLIGFQYILFIVVALIFEWAINPIKSRKQLILPSVLTLAAIVIPILSRLHFALTYQQIFVYPMQDFKPVGWFLLIPSTAILFLIMLSNLFLRKLSWIAGLIQLGVIVLVAIGGFRAKANFDLEKTLSIDSELYFNNISKARQLSLSHNLRSSVGAYYYNLINAISGTLPDHFLEGNQTGTRGLFLPVDYQQNYITITFSNEVFYYLGDVNASQHFALLGTIFSPKQQSSRLMRRLAQINIINGEYAVAEKYLKMLGKTLFHKRWARSVEPLLYEEDLRAQSAWISNKRGLKPHSQIIKKSNDNETTLKLLLESNPDNYLAKDYLLCLYLMEKNLEAFFQVYSEEIENTPNIRIPELYQQALLIINVRYPDTPIWGKIRIDTDLIKRFTHYTNQFDQYLGDGEYLKAEFENTYWFYYHYASTETE